MNDLSMHLPKASWVPPAEGDIRKLISVNRLSQDLGIIVAVYWWGNLKRQKHWEASVNLHYKPLRKHVMVRCLAHMWGNTAQRFTAEGSPFQHLRGEWVMKAMWDGFVCKNQRKHGWFFRQCAMNHIKHYATKNILWSRKPAIIPGWTKSKGFLIAKLRR